MMFVPYGIYAYNTITEVNMRTIPLANTDLVAQVSDEDYEYLAQFRWFLDNQGYALPTRKIDGKRQWPMHHLITIRSLGDIPDGRHIDHANRNKLDNQRENLRICTPLQNAANSAKPRCRLGVSKYKGVSKAGDGIFPWRAQIAVGRKNRHLGVFRTEEEAAAAYNRAAAELHAEFAWLNPVSDTIPAEREHKSFFGKPRGASGFRGVTKHKNKWTASIFVNGKNNYLGLFSTPEEAARAYDRKAYELFGDAAPLNFPDELERHEGTEQ
jgi:hypothetical protein